MAAQVLRLIAAAIANGFAVFASRRCDARTEASGLVPEGPAAQLLEVRRPVPAA